MKRQYILFVEDEKFNHELFSYAVQDWNAAHAEQGKEFVPEIATSYEDAVTALARFKIDCALLDLRLPEKSDGKENPTFGNKLANEVLFIQGLPLAILSGHPDEVDESLKDGELVNTFNKGDKNGFEHALAWLAEKWDMMETLRAAKASIDEMSATVFANRLWPSWNTISQLEQGNQGKLIKIIARQYVSHIADILGLDGELGIKWHPYENYNVPSLFPDRAHTGDIFERDGDLWVVLTPQCDMANQKITNVILAKCVSGIEHWENNIELLKNPPSETQKKKANKFFGDLVNQNLAASSHFLPPLPGKAAPLMVDFSDIHTVPLVDLNKQLKTRVASVSNPFISNLVQRFGSYISRTGQPNLEIDHFIN